MDLIVNHKTEILAGLFFLSEILALIPSIKANSVFQLNFDINSDIMKLYIQSHNKVYYFG